ncbi:MAG: UTRA domain-containing protein [Hyphomicrobiaceae bacterium]
MPVCFSTYWYPHDRLGSIAEAFARTGTATKALAKFGISAYRRKETRVLSRRPDSQEHHVLQLDRRTHILCIDALAVDSNDVPIRHLRSFGSPTEFSWL